MEAVTGFFRGLTGAPEPAAASTAATASSAAGGVGETTGLLSQWNTYQQQADVESGATGPSGQMQKTVEELGTTVLGMFRTGYQQVSQQVEAGVSSLPGIQTSIENTLPSTQQLTYFGVLMAASLTFLSLSFFVFLPVIILAPSKFALTFTIGCLLFMSAFIALRGWRTQVAAMFSRERLPFTISYLLSILVTLWGAFVHSYLLSLLFSALQLVALTYFVSSYFPGGAAAASSVLRTFGSVVMSCCRSIAS